MNVEKHFHPIPFPTIEQKTVHQLRKRSPKSQNMLNTMTSGNTPRRNGQDGSFCLDFVWKKDTESFNRIEC